MFARLRSTWSLMGASWDVLRKTKGLVLFPILSVICCGLVAASFIVPLIVTDAWAPPQGNADLGRKIAYYAMWFAFYFCNYAVITFFNAAVIAGAFARMTGGEPTVGSCFGEALKRLHLILGWAAVSATVGLVLRLIEDRSPKIGQFTAGLLGVAWTLASFLVVPALVVDNLGPIAALKDSGKRLRQTWGEHLVGNFSFGLIFFLLALPAMALIGLGVYSLVPTQNPIIGFGCIAVGVIYWIVLALVQSTLQAIFQAAVYLYTKGVHDHGFPPELMAAAMRGKG